MSATAGIGSATVSWTAPSNGGSAITSYVVTPFAGGSAQTPTTITGSPPATSATIGGLTNGTAYTFTVIAANAVGPGPASAASNSVTPTAPTVPSAPTNVTATAGNASASVSWSAPANGGSAITGYTITPFAAGIGQAFTSLTGTPPPTSTKITSLINGTPYTFTVSAANSVGAGPVSSPSNAVTPQASASPAFVQTTSKRGDSVASVAVAPTANVTTGNRLVVQVGIWSGAAATAKSVTDSAGNVYTELLHFKAADNTEMSVWTAPITAGGGTKPTITVTPTAKADVGASAVEYSGLSTAAGAAAVDQMAQAAGTTGATNATVASGATAATASANELAAGFYADSGFGDALGAGAGFTSRVNVSPTGDMELLVEDATVGAGATPNATVQTGPGTPWLMATIVFKGSG